MYHLFLGASTTGTPIEVPAGLSLNEAKKYVLEVLTSQTGKTVGELEKIWLESETGVSGRTVGELWLQWLTDLGFTAGTIRERFYAYLGGLSYTGNLNEREYAFWSAGGP